MGLHSLLISDLGGNLIFSRYFEQATGQVSTAAGMANRESEMRAWEAEVMRQTQDLWGGAVHTMQVARAREDVFVVFRRVGDMLVFLCGMDDTDELILSTTVGVIGAILFALCEEAKCNKPSETRILVGDLYGKLSVCLDELMPGGILESMDPSAVLAMSKLKPCTTTTSTTTSST